MSKKNKDIAVFVAEDTPYNRRNVLGMVRGMNNPQLLTSEEWILSAPEKQGYDVTPLRFVTAIIARLFLIHVSKIDDLSGKNYSGSLKEDGGVILILDQQMPPFNITGDSIIVGLIKTANYLLQLASAEDLNKLADDEKIEKILEYAIISYLRRERNSFTEDDRSNSSLEKEYLTLLKNIDKKYLSMKEISDPNKKADLSSEIDEMALEARSLLDKINNVESEYPSLDSSFSIYRFDDEAMRSFFSRLFIIGFSKEMQYFGAFGKEGKGEWVGKRSANVVKKIKEIIE